MMSASAAAFLAEKYPQICMRFARLPSSSISIGLYRTLSVRMSVSPWSLYGQLPFSVSSSHFSFWSVTDSTFLTFSCTQSPLREVSVTIETLPLNDSHFLSSDTSYDIWEWVLVQMMICFLLTDSACSVGYIVFCFNCWALVEIALICFCLFY